MSNKVICIDGPAASGKSTLARQISHKTGFLHVDSGALYRIATLMALDAGLDTADAAALGGFVRGLDVKSEVSEGSVVFLVKGRAPGDELRSPRVNAAVSPVSAVPAVRERITQWLRGLRSLGPLVVEGRDIGSVVFPDSPARFYLVADADERARRRLKDDVEKGFAEESAVEKVRDSLLNRDKIDSTRKAAPLRIAPGSIVVDNTKLAIEETVAKVMAALPEGFADA